MGATPVVLVRRVVPLGCVLALVSGLLAVGAPAVTAQAQTGPAAETVRVSVASDGAQSDAASVDPVVSADGRVVAFHSEATSLVVGDTNGVLDVFVHELATGETSRVSVASDGAQGNGNSFDPRLSADGRWVTFRSHASNLVAGDTNGAHDIFVHDRVTGETERVSVASDGSQPNGDARNPHISGDGSLVTFASTATNLVAGDSNGVRDIFVHDRTTGTTSRVSVATDGTEGDGLSDDPAISADGSTVAFKSLATNLDGSDTNGVRDVFVHDRASGQTSRVSAAPDGSQADGLSDNPALSADGSLVGFDSAATNLVAGDVNGRDDVFVHDRATGQTSLISIATDGTQGDRSSDDPQLSADGSLVAFSSVARNLVAGDTNARSDIFVHDRTTGQTSRVSVATDGTQADDASYQPGIAADGTVIVYHADATNLVPGDTNLHRDVLAWRSLAVDDGVAPSVEVTAPAFGELVWADVTVAADAADDIGVDRVEFAVAGTSIGTDSTAPYSVVWDSTEVPDGDYLVTVTVFDTAGNAASDAVGVRVANGLDVTGQLDADLDAGRISVEQYVLNAIYALVGDPALDPRYSGAVPEHPSMWLWRVLLHGDQLSPQGQDEVRAHLVPEVTEQPDEGAGSFARSLGPVDCTSMQAQLKSSRVPLDCRISAGSVDVWWSSGNPPPDVDENGLPDKVEAYGRGFIDAQEQFETVLGYAPTGRVDAFLVDPRISCGLSLPPLDFVAAGGQRTILLDHECGEPSYLAMHELFHQYQWDYLSPWDLSSVEAIKEISWWGEATAEWAAHQVLAANDAEYVGTEDRFAYADRLPAFLNTAWQHIDDLGRDVNARQYGAFAVAEWLHHITADPASIKRTFEDISVLTSPTAAIDGELGGTWNAQVPAMWRDLYFLDLPVPDRVDQAETDEWRSDLPVGTPFGNAGRPEATSLSLTAGDSETVTFELGAAGAKFIEIGASDHGTLDVQLASDATGIDLQILALESYDTDPAVDPVECAASTVEPISSFRMAGSVEFSPVNCAGVVLIVSRPDKDARNLTDVAVQVSLGDRVDTTITNGTVRLGIHTEGHLNVDGYESSSGTGTSVVGLRYVPTNADALSPGCLCEGWGIADPGRGFTGWGNEAAGGVLDLVVEHAEFDATRGSSTVLADGVFRVTHDFRPSPDTPNLYQIDVTIENAAELSDWPFGGFFGPLTPTYRRVMDWDVEPTAFSEFVTIGVPTIHVPAELKFSSNDGFAPADPLAGPSDIGAVGLFTDEGPYDHGALFDLEFPPIDPGESVTFTMYYGATGNETDALAALDAVGATLYSLAQPDVPGGASTGEPNTFIWAYRPFVASPSVASASPSASASSTDASEWQASLGPAAGDPPALTRDQWP